MNGRRGWLGLAALAVLVIAALAVWRVERRAGEREEAVVSEVPVRVGALSRTTLRRIVETFGTVEPAPAESGAPAASARVAAPVTGTVATVSCVEGQRVARGAELVRLDTRVVDAQIVRAKQAVEFAELTVARQKTMLADNATSQRAEQEAEAQLAVARGELAAAEAERALLVITAPLAGAVVRVNARPGDAVDPSTVLVELVDFDRLVVAAAVPSAQAVLVKPGQTVELPRRPAAGGDAESPGLTGTVVFVGTQLDAKNDTIPVRITLPADSGLLPGQFLGARIVVETRPGCLAAPEEAVVRDAEGHSAIAVVEGDKAVLKPVRTGVREKGLVEVEGEGLGEGTRIVTEGAYGLPAETKIKIVGS